MSKETTMITKNKTLQNLDNLNPLTTYYVYRTKVGYHITETLMSGGKLLLRFKTTKTGKMPINYYKEILHADILR